MDESVRGQLRDIVVRFYEERGDAFAAHREGPWPGFSSVLTRIPEGAVLDVGCGEGRFGVALARMSERTGAQSAQTPCYVGVDASRRLLERARTRNDLPRDHRFERLDVAADPEALPPGPFAGVVALGLLHHVPGREQRGALLDAMAARLLPGGILAVTLWRFRDIPRLARLELPLEPAGLDPATLEPGDALLSFGGDPSVPRYCHFFDAEEVDWLIERCPFPLVDRFRQDGRENELNEYLVWERPV